MMVSHLMRVVQALHMRLEVCTMMIRPVIIAHSCIINIIIIGDIVRLSDVEIKYALEYLA